METPQEEAERRAYEAKSVEVEPLALHEEYVRVSGDMAYWGSIYATAERTFQLAELAHKRVTAQLQLEWRETLKARSDKVTEAVVDANVTCDHRYFESKVASIDAEVEKIRVRGLLEAVRAKSSMLVSLGAHVRAEMAADPRVRSEQAFQGERQRNGG